jgi:predicted small lipoprotein YifL
MKTRIFILMLVLMGALIAGCSSDGPLALKDDQGTDVALENRDQPALVFFFTGVE